MRLLPVGGNLSGLMHFDYNLIHLEIMVDLSSEMLCVILLPFMVQRLTVFICILMD